MDYAAWKLFIDAAELGSLSKVAVAYGTSQPHISRQISELEQECGGRLFQRTGRGVVLTELGQRIAPQGARVAGEHRAACERHPHLGRQADRQGPDRQSALDRASAGQHALSTPEGTISADSAGSARRARARSSRRGWRMAASILRSFIERVRRRRTATSIWSRRRPISSSAAGDPLTSRPTVPFSALHNLPLVLFCRPNSWRDHLEQIGAERGVSLNVALEADSLQPANAHRL